MVRGCSTGEEGKGRFRALALGRVAEWSVTAKNLLSQRVRYRITMIKDSARTFRITDPEPVDDDCKIGVEVTISEPYKDWNLQTPGLLQELNEIYALYLTDYSTVRISLLGARGVLHRPVELAAVTGEIKFHFRWTVIRLIRSQNLVSSTLGLEI